MESGRSLCDLSQHSFHYHIDLISALRCHDSSVVCVQKREIRVKSEWNQWWILYGPMRGSGGLEIQKKTNIERRNHRDHGCHFRSFSSSIAISRAILAVLFATINGINPSAEPSRLSRLIDPSLWYLVTNILNWLTGDRDMAYLVSHHRMGLLPRS